MSNFLIILFSNDKMCVIPTTTAHSSLLTPLENVQVVWCYDFTQPADPLRHTDILIKSRSLALDSPLPWGSVDSGSTLHRWHKLGQQLHEGHWGWESKRQRSWDEGGKKRKISKRKWDGDRKQRHQRGLWGMSNKELQTLKRCKQQGRLQWENCWHWRHCMMSCSTAGLSQNHLKASSHL